MIQDNKEQTIYSLLKGFVAGLLLPTLLFYGCGGTRSNMPREYKGSFQPCPDRPNCVNSQATDGHYIEPYMLEASPQKTWQALKALIENFEGEKTSLVTVQENYLHVEFKSSFFGFIDDVEFYLEPGGKFIAIRSASRLGYGDMGANRKRMEKIREGLRARGLVRALSDAGKPKK